MILMAQALTPAARRLGVGVLVLFVLFVFTKSGLLYTYYFIHIFT